MEHLSLVDLLQIRTGIDHTIIIIFCLNFCVNWDYPYGDHFASFFHRDLGLILTSKQTVRVDLRITFYPILVSYQLLQGVKYMFDGYLIHIKIMS